MDDACGSTGQLENWSLNISRSSAVATLLADTDGDTRISVEDLPDEDIVRMEVGGMAGLEIRPDSATFKVPLRVTGNFISGSSTNTASGPYSFVGGGFGNTASDYYSFVGGGFVNTASGSSSFVGGGIGLTAESYAEAVFGTYNTDYVPMNAIGFDVDDRLFVIGNGISSDTRSNAVTVLKNGNVGIGTDGPLSKLSLGSTLGNTKLALYETSSTNKYGMGVQSGLFRFHTSNSSQRFGFFDGASGSATEVFTIRTNGNVGIGINSPSQRLHVVGNICATGTIGSCSDQRYKKDMLPITDALSSLTRLNGRYYYWKREAFPEKEFTADRQIGLIAQEVQAIFPEMVQTDDEGYLSVDYSRLTPVLVEAVKELARQNEEQLSSMKKQQVEIEKLQSKLSEMEELKNRLAKIEALLSQKTRPPSEAGE